MSFLLTPVALLEGRKSVTRRLGWQRLTAGRTVDAVLKSQGRRPGEPLLRLAVIRVVDVRREPLHTITDDDVAREGFAGRDAAWFVRMFVAAHRAAGVAPDTIVTRIAFELLERTPDGEQLLADYAEGQRAGLVGEREPRGTRSPGWSLGWEVGDADRRAIAGYR